VPPHVAWLSIAPVKGLALVHPDEIALDEHGVAENRRFCLVDEQDRRYGALRDGRLQQIQVEYDAVANRLALRFPDGAVAEGDVALCGTIATDLYHQQIPLRLLEGPWNEVLSQFAGRSLRLGLADRPGGSVDRDRGPVSLVSDASVEELGRRSGHDGPVDGRRFRMLIGLGGCEPHEEDGWCGRDVRVGEAVVRPLEPVARCAITTQSPETGERDFDTLRAIKEYRGVRPSDGKSLDFGVFGTVVTPGRVRVGDPVEPLDA